MANSFADTDFLALAPTELVSRRKARYHGDDQAVRVGSFTADDQRALQKIYTFLQELFVVSESICSGAGSTDSFAAFLRGFSDFIDAAQGVGIASYRATPSTLLAEVIHDIRGGGLSAIIGILEVWQLKGGGDEVCETLRLLARDQLKIMRNALVGLDDTRRVADLELKLHSTDLILEKWRKLKIPAAAETLVLEGVCPHSIPIAECCVEFGAIDRILYNLLNNAGRHTADLRVRLTLIPVPESTGPNLRFVMQNALKESDGARLKKMALSTLFEVGTSSTGSGYGMAIVAEFVAHAFGISVREAIADGHLGAKIIGNDFTVWFHWPIVSETNL